MGGEEGKCRVLSCFYRNCPNLYPRRQKVSATERGCSHSQPFGFAKQTTLLIGEVLKDLIMDIY